MKIWEVFNFDCAIFKHEPLMKLLMKFSLGYELKSNDFEMQINNLTPSTYEKIFLVDFKHTECQWLIIRSNELGIKSAGRNRIQTIDFEFKSQRELKPFENMPTYVIEPITTFMVNSKMDIFIKGNQ